MPDDLRALLVELGFCVDAERFYTLRHERFTLRVAVTSAPNQEKYLYMHFFNQETQRPTAVTLPVLECLERVKLYLRSYGLNIDRILRIKRLYALLLP